MGLARTPPAGIVVGTDLSLAADRAIEEAHARAERDGGTLTVVHVLPPRVPPFTLKIAVAPDDELQRARVRVTQRVMRLVGRRAGSFEVIVTRGSASAVLPFVAATCGPLVVIANRGHTDVKYSILGSVAGELVAHGHSATLVTRTSATAPAGPVVVGADLQAASMPVLVAAADECVRAGAPLMVVHSVHAQSAAVLTLDTAAAIVEGGAAIGPRLIAANAERWLRAAVERVGVGADCRIVEGRPDDRILDIATEVDARLVVVGTSRREGGPRDVTHSVVRRARCPVLVVHAR